MAQANPSDNRPLSPHLQVYKFMINTVMSIFHRMTGMALYFGTLLLAWWLIAAAYGPEHFAVANWFFGSIFGQIILFGYTWALLHHLLGGVRHFIWDTGAGFDLATIDRLGWATIIGSVSLTLLVWIVALTLGGAS
ncbi:MAG: succinate dehydrogenase, cytochrome b556 subunit [Pseudomonadota bacterium]